MSREFELRSETHVVATRMEVYKGREKMQPILDKCLKKNQGRLTLATKALIHGMKPRAVILKVTYKELDFNKPIDDNCFDEPGVVLSEVSVDDGSVLEEFKLSFDEAKNLGQLLANL